MLPLFSGRKRKNLEETACQGVKIKLPPAVATPWGVARLTCPDSVQAVDIAALSTCPDLALTWP